MKTKIEFKAGSWNRFNSFLIILASVWFYGVPVQILASPGDVDLSFDPGSSVNGDVFAIAAQGDGKILIGGIFSTIHGSMCSGLARLNVDGSVDESFQISLKSGPVYTDPYITSIAVQNDGKILIGGMFYSVNGVARTNFARLNADGTLDASFLDKMAGTDAGIKCISLQDDGKILIGGLFTKVNGVGMTSLARLNPDGSLDTSFATELTPGDSVVESIALQNDGMLLIGGWFYVDGEKACLARLNADGSLDSVLGGLSGDWDYVDDVVVQDDGKIMISGLFDLVNGIARKNLARLNADGSVDVNFLNNLAGTDGEVRRITLQNDGKMIIGGLFQSVNGEARSYLARLNADGSLDNSFSSDLYSYWGVQSLALQTDGKILVSGGPEPVNFPGRYLFRLNADGSMDSDFKNGPSGPDTDVYCAATQPDGRILIGGSFGTVNWISRGKVARLMPDGTLDKTFLDGMAGADGTVWSLALQEDGKVVIGGEFKSVNGVARLGVARLNADGSLDLSFSNNLGGYVYALGLQKNGKIIAGGTYRANNLARLNSDGSTDDTFGSYMSGYWGVMCLTVQRDDKILIGGYFSWVNTAARNRIARLNSDGSLDNSFLNGMAGMDQVVWSIAVQDDGKVLAGGWFSTVNGFTRNGFVRLNIDGSVDTGFIATGPNWDGASSIALQGDGKILVGGDFSSFNGAARAKLARLNPDGSLDNSFLAAISSTYGEVRCILLQGDSKILIGGGFTAVNQTPRSFIARLLGEYSPPAIQTPPQCQTAEIGSSVELNVGASGSCPMTYMWILNGTNVVSAATTNSALSLANVQSSRSGSYIVVITNSAGSLTSAPAMLNLIPAVERRPVPAISLTGEAGSVLNIEYASVLAPLTDWSEFDTVYFTNATQFYFDLTTPLPPQRFYRAWQAGTPGTIPSLKLLGMVPAITLTGNVGDSLQLDYINQFGPTDAWVTLDTVTLTNPSQLYFDVTAIGQPPRLWRIVPVP